jgi:hypothetical protein
MGKWIVLMPITATGTATGERGGTLQWTALSYLPVQRGAHCRVSPDRGVLSGGGPEHRATALSAPTN